MELVDLRSAIGAVDPDYFGEACCDGPFAARLNVVHHCNTDRRLYVVFAGSYLFTTVNGGASVMPVREINEHVGALAAKRSQFVDAVVETLSGTVLVFGRDTRDGEMRGIVWRKAIGELQFTRHVTTWPAWPSSKSGNATAGFFGTGATEMVALAIYASPAHLYFSLDDGRTFKRQDMHAQFLEHVHMVYLPRAKTLNRTARLWVTGGDDPTGAKSGALTFSSLDPDGMLAGLQWVMRERPGYRLVGLAGDGKHVYIGNESVAGGVIRILDNQEAIAQQDFEYALGKSRHDYHQFRTLVATPDGWLVSLTDSYVSTGDTLRADSGGYLYMSADGGATFAETSLGAKWSTSLTYDGRTFWSTCGMNPPEELDPSEHRLCLWKFDKRIEPGAADSLVVKPVIVDSSDFYAMAGYADHPRATLQPGERSLRVNFAKRSSVAVAVETFGAATLVIEAAWFESWQSAATPWREIATLELSLAGRQQVFLEGPSTHHRLFRVRNAGAAACEIKSLIFSGRL